MKLSLALLFVLNLMTQRNVVARNPTNASDDNLTATIVCGGGTLHECTSKMDTALKTDLHPFRCCSEADFFNGKKKNFCGVWAGSKTMMSCNKAKTYEGAKASCARVGARLCSKEELLGNCAEGTGCNLDTSLVWTVDPVELDIFNPTRIVVGGYHSCALDKVGGLFCWGNNRYGQLGNGETSEHPSIVPTEVKLDNKAFKVQLGVRFSCVVDSLYEVWCWGSNSHGQLGTGDIVDKSIPTKVDLKGGAIELRLGGMHACLIDKNRKLFCWGSNNYGQIGNGVISSEPVPPTGVEFENLVTQVRLGYHHSCVTDSESKLFCWGRNTYGQIGSGESSRHVPTPTKINLGQPKNKLTIEAGESLLVLDFAVGTDHSCMIDSEKTVSCWGRNNFGQLGTGDSSDVTKPTTVKSLFEEPSNIVAKSHNTCIMEDDKLFCWGSGEFGRFGTGDNENRLTPSEVKLKEGSMDYSMGHSHTCIVDNAMKFRCWGSNGSGQLGIGGVLMQSTPSIIDFSPSEEEIDNIASLIAEEIPNEDKDLLRDITISGPDEL